MKLYQNLVFHTAHLHVMQVAIDDNVYSGNLLDLDQKLTQPIEAKIEFDLQKATNKDMILFFYLVKIIKMNSVVTPDRLIIRDKVKRIKQYIIDNNFPSPLWTYVPFYLVQIGFHIKETTKIVEMQDTADQYVQYYLDESFLDFGFLTSSCNSINVKRMTKIYKSSKLNGTQQKCFIENFLLQSIFIPLETISTANESLLPFVHSLQAVYNNVIRKHLSNDGKNKVEDETYNQVYQDYNKTVCYFYQNLKLENQHDEQQQIQLNLRNQFYIPFHFALSSIDDKITNKWNIILKLLIQQSNAFKINHFLYNFSSNQTVEIIDQNTNPKDKQVVKQSQYYNNFIVCDSSKSGKTTLMQSISYYFLMLPEHKNNPLPINVLMTDEGDRTNCKQANYLNFQKYLNQMTFDYDADLRKQLDVNHDIITLQDLKQLHSKETILSNLILSNLLKQFGFFEVQNEMSEAIINQLQEIQKQKQQLHDQISSDIETISKSINKFLKSNSQLKRDSEKLYQIIKFLAYFDQYQFSKMKNTTKIQQFLSFNLSQVKKAQIGFNQKQFITQISKTNKLNYEQQIISNEQQIIILFDEVCSRLNNKQLEIQNETFLIPLIQSIQEQNCWTTVKKQTLGLFAEKMQLEEHKNNKSLKYLHNLIQSIDELKFPYLACQNLIYYNFSSNLDIQQIGELMSPKALQAITLRNIMYIVNDKIQKQNDYAQAEKQNKQLHHFDQIFVSMLQEQYQINYTDKNDEKYQNQLKVQLDAYKEQFNHQTQVVHVYAGTDLSTYDFIRFDTALKQSEISRNQFTKHITYNCYATVLNVPQFHPSQLDQYYYYYNVDYTESMCRKLQHANNELIDFGVNNYNDYQNCPIYWLFNILSGSYLKYSQNIISHIIPQLVITDKDNKRILYQKEKYCIMQQIDQQKTINIRFNEELFLGMFSFMINYIQKNDISKNQNKKTSDDKKMTKLTKKQIIFTFVQNFKQNQCIFEKEQLYLQPQFHNNIIVMLLYISKFIEIFLDKLEDETFNQTAKIIFSYLEKNKNNKGVSTMLETLFLIKLQLEIQYYLLLHNNSKQIIDNAEISFNGEDDAVVQKRNSIFNVQKLINFLQLIFKGNSYEYKYCFDLFNTKVNSVLFLQQLINLQVRKQNLIQFSTIHTIKLQQLQQNEDLFSTVLNNLQPVKDYFFNVQQVDVLLIGVVIDKEKTRTFIENSAFNQDALPNAVQNDAPISDFMLIIFQKEQFIKSFDESLTVKFMFEVGPHTKLSQFLKSRNYPILSIQQQVLSNYSQVPTFQISSIKVKYYFQNSQLIPKKSFYIKIHKSLTKLQFRNILKIIYKCCSNFTGIDAKNSMDHDVLTYLMKDYLVDIMKQINSHQKKIKENIEKIHILLLSNIIEYNNKQMQQIFILLLDTAYKLEQNYDSVFYLIFLTEMYKQLILKNNFGLSIYDVRQLFDLIANFTKNFLISKFKYIPQKTILELEEQKQLLQQDKKTSNNMEQVVNCLHLYVTMTQGIYQYEYWIKQQVQHKFGQLIENQQNNILLQSFNSSDFVTQHSDKNSNPPTNNCLPREDMLETKNQQNQTQVIETFKTSDSCTKHNCYYSGYSSELTEKSNCEKIPLYEISQCYASHIADIDFNDNYRIFIDKEKIENYLNQVEESMINEIITNQPAIISVYNSIQMVCTEQPTLRLKQKSFRQKFDQFLFTSFQYVNLIYIPDQEMK